MLISVQIEIVEPFDAGIRQIYVNNGVIIGGLQVFVGRPEMIEEIRGFEIPGFKNGWKEEETEVRRDEGDNKQEGINFKVLSLIDGQS